MLGDVAVRLPDSGMKVMDFFLRSALLILLLTAFLKLGSALSSGRLLSHTDPLLSLTYKQMFLLLGSLELGVAYYIQFGRNQRLKLILIAWLATNFAAYRLAAWAGNIGQPCSCLGRATEWFPWIAAHEQFLLKWMVFFLLLGSYALLLMHSRWGRLESDKSKCAFQARGRL